MLKHFEKGRWLVSIWEEWSQFFESCNWYTFRFFMFEVEDERNMGTAEVTLVVMGFGLRVVFRHTDTEFAKEIGRQIGEMFGPDREDLK